MNFKISKKTIELILSIVLIQLLFSCKNHSIEDRLASFDCEKCKNHLNSNFKLTSELLPLITRGNEYTIDGPDWDKKAKRRFGNVSKIRMCKIGSRNTFKNHLFCYIGMEYERFLKLFPVEMKYRVDEYGDSTLVLNIELEIAKAYKYPEIVWNGTWKPKFIFEKNGSKFTFIGDETEMKKLKMCLDSIN